MVPRRPPDGPGHDRTDPPAATAKRDARRPVPRAARARAGRGELVAHAHGLALALADGFGVAVAVTDPPVVLAVIGGLAIGMPLAAQVLHREHARPLGRAEGGARYAYTRQGRRRMAAGLAAGYLTAAALACVLASTTSASRELMSLLAY
jgi:predicted NBD/HSP70 family sugar kinase